MNIHHITIEAQTARKVFEKHHEQLAEQYVSANDLIDFPHKADATASEYLAYWLYDTLGAKSIEYRWGTSLLSGSSHTWLCIDGFVIDITADQFGLSPVFVQPNSNFHHLFYDVESLNIIEGESYPDGYFAFKTHMLTPIADVG